MIRPPPRATRTDTSFPTRRSSDLYIDRGLVLFEYRNLVRDPVDMTAALLARAGGAKAFVGNHQAIFAAFPAMIAKVQKATEAHKKCWFEGTTAERARKIDGKSGV